MRPAAATASIVFVLSLFAAGASVSASELKGYVHVRELEDRGDEVLARIAGQIFNEGGPPIQGASLILADASLMGGGPSLGTVSLQAGDSWCFSDDLTVPRDALLRWQQNGAPRLQLEATDPDGVAILEEVEVIPMQVDGDLVRSRTAAAEGSAPIITTVAGGGPNGLPAVEANLSAPGALALDTAGNIYVVAAGSGQVFRIDPAGMLTSAAGRGVVGSYYGSVGLAIDAAGNLFVALGNGIYRADTATGLFQRIAGTGYPEYSGDGGPAIAAGFFSPSQLAFDPAGRLLVSDRCNHRIRRIDMATGVVTSVAGSTYDYYYPGAGGGAGDGGPATAALLDSPDGVAVDPQGNIFIADTNDDKVRRVDAATGRIDTWAGTGAPGYNGENLDRLSARLYLPRGLSIAPDGDLLVADSENNRVRRVDAQTGLVSTVAGTGTGGSTGDGGPASSAKVRLPGTVLALGSGDVLIGDTWNHRVRRVSAVSGLIGPLAGNGTQYFSGDGFPGTRGSIPQPGGLALDYEGNLLIADGFNGRIRKLDRRSLLLSTIAGTGGPRTAWTGQPALEAGIGGPRYLATDRAGRILYFLSGDLLGRIDLTSGTITKAAGDTSGGPAPPNGGDGGAATSARFISPSGVALDAQGNIYVVDYSAAKVRRIDVGTGIIRTIAGKGGQGSGGDGGPALNAQFRVPLGLAVDDTGNVFIADTNNSRVRKVDSAGIITTAAGNGTFGSDGDGGPATSATLRPQGLSVDPAGNLFIADPYASKIRRVDRSTGIISTVAGSGGYGFSGDGGPATQAKMAGPHQVLSGDRGALFISDEYSNRVRRVAPPNAPPHAAITGGGAFECTGPLGQTLSLDASGSSDDDSTPGTADDIVTYDWLEFFGTPGEIRIGEGPSLDLVARLGAPRAVTLKVTDRAGAGATADVTVSIVDTTPPAFSLTASQQVLWPPNHRMVEVAMSAHALDTCGDASWAIQSAASDEPDDAPGSGDGATTSDMQGVEPGSAGGSVLLRAERQASGPGRSYTLTYAARDASGNAAGAAVLVRVPHDERGIVDPIDLSVEERGEGTLIWWQDVPGAACFDVVRGAVGALASGGSEISLGDVTCVEACSADAATRGHEDASIPSPGEAWFYLVESLDSRGASSSLGTESATRPYRAAGGCR